MRQRAFVLGGQAVLHVDHLEQLPGLTPMDVSRIPADVDLPALLHATGFSAEEIQYLVANKVHGVPRARMAEFLAWDIRTVERTARRCTRKLARLTGEDLPAAPKGSSVRLSLLEQLPSGRRSWELQPLGPEFPEEMAKTFSNIFVAECPSGPTLTTSR